MRYLTSGSLRAGSVGSSALSLESLNVDLLGLVAFSADVYSWVVSGWDVVAAAAACRAVLELSEEILDVKGVRLKPEDLAAVADRRVSNGVNV